MVNINLTVMQNEVNRIGANKACSVLRLMELLLQRFFASGGSEFKYREPTPR